MSDAVGTNKYILVIFHPSIAMKGKFIIMCIVIFLVRLQGEFEIDSLQMNDDCTVLPILTTTFTTFLVKCWKNLLFELRSERVNLNLSSLFFCSTVSLRVVWPIWVLRADSHGLFTDVQGPWNVWGARTDTWFPGSRILAWCSAWEPEAWYNVLLLVWLNWGQ